MAKLNWQKLYKQGTTEMVKDYWCNPKKGFDKQWHDQQANTKATTDRQLRDKALNMIRSNTKG